MDQPRWIAYAAISIAVFALGLTIYQGRQTREHLRRASQPVFFVDFSEAEEGAGFRWGNAGAGAGRLHWFLVEVDKSPQPDWSSVFDECWVFTRFLETRAVESCASPPEILLAEPTR